MLLQKWLHHCGNGSSEPTSQLRPLRDWTEDLTLIPAILVSSVVEAAASAPSAATAHSAGTSSATSAAAVFVFLAFGDVDSKDPVFEQCSVELEGLPQRLAVLKLDVAEPLELVGFPVADKTNTPDLEEESKFSSTPKGMTESY